MALVGRTFSTFDRKPALLLLATLSLLQPAHALHNPFADFGPGNRQCGGYKRSNSHRSVHRSLSSAGNAVTLNMAKLDSPSAQRNKEPIWDILSSKVLPLIHQQDPLQVLEVAAGCGVHSHYFSLQLVQQEKREFEWYPRYVVFIFLYAL